MKNLNDLYENGYIQIDNSWFKVNKNDNLNEQIGTDGFYLLINFLERRTFNNTVGFNKQLISNMFGANRNNNWKTAYQALEKLVNNNIIIPDKIINFNKPKSEDFIEVNINYPITFSKNYFILFNDHFQILMKYQGNECKHKLFSLFCAIRCNAYENQCSCLTLKTLSNLIKISDKTIVKYIKILQDLDLIIYDNPGTRIFSNGKIKESPNFYTIAIDIGNDILNQGIESYKKDQINNGVQFITKDETLTIMKQRRINTCKQKRADYMLEHNQLDEETYNEINSECEKRKEELSWMPDGIDFEDYEDQFLTPEQLKEETKKIAKLMGVDITDNYDPFEGVEEVIEDIEKNVVILNDEFNELEKYLTDQERIENIIKYNNITIEYYLSLPLDDRSSLDGNYDMQL